MYDRPLGDQGRRATTGGPFYGTVEVGPISDTLHRCEYKVNVGPLLLK